MASNSYAPSLASSKAEIERSAEHNWETTYPDGGLRAWLVVLGCWMALFAGLGVMNTLATFQTYVVSHQLAGIPDGTVGWVFSLFTFLSFFLGIYAGPLFDKYGPRWLVFLATLGLFAGLMLFSVCTGKSIKSLLES